MKTKTHTPKPNPAAKQETEVALDGASCSAVLDSRIKAARAEVRNLRDEIKRLEKEKIYIKRQMPKKEQKSAIAARPRRMEIFRAVGNGKTYKEVGVEYGISGGRVRQIVLTEWRRVNHDHYVMYNGDAAALRANPLPNAEVSHGDRERQPDTHPTPNQP